jgi:hypothetical protein
MKTKFIGYPDDTKLKRLARQNALDILEEFYYREPNDTLSNSELEYVHDDVEGYLRYRHSVEGVQTRFYHSPGAMVAYKIVFVVIDDDQEVHLDVTRDDFFREIFDDLISTGVLYEKRKAVAN